MVSSSCSNSSPRMLSPTLSYTYRQAAFQPIGSLHHAPTIKLQCYAMVARSWALTKIALFGTLAVLALFWHFQAPSIGKAQIASGCCTAMCCLTRSKIAASWIACWLACCHNQQWWRKWYFPSEENAYDGVNLQNIGNPDTDLMPYSLKTLLCSSQLVVWCVGLLLRCTRVLLWAAAAGKFFFSWDQHPFWGAWGVWGDHLFWRKHCSHAEFWISASCGTT